LLVFPLSPIYRSIFGWPDSSSNVFIQL
jgi:hypothetical protein